MGSKPVGRALCSTIYGMCVAHLPCSLNRANVIFLVQGKAPGFTYDTMEHLFVRADGLDDLLHTPGTGHCMAQVCSFSDCMYGALNSREVFPFQAITVFSYPPDGLARRGLHPG